MEVFCKCLFWKELFSNGIPISVVGQIKQTEGQRMNDEPYSSICQGKFHSGVSLNDRDTGLYQVKQISLLQNCQSFIFITTLMHTQEGDRDAAFAMLTVYVEVCNHSGITNGAVRQTYAEIQVLSLTSCVPCASFVNPLSTGYLT